MSRRIRTVDELQELFQKMWRKFWNEFQPESQEQREYHQACAQACLRQARYHYLQMTAEEAKGLIDFAEKGGVTISWDMPPCAVLKDPNKIISCQMKAMKCKWVIVDREWRGTEGKLLLKLRNQFPDVKFRLGKRGKLFNREYCSVMALLPYPHPNPAARIVCEFAAEQSALLNPSGGEDANDPK